MPAIRDFAQNYTSVTTAAQKIDTPDYAENDLLVAVCSVDTSNNPSYWSGGEAATAVWNYDNTDGWTAGDMTAAFNDATTADWYLTSASPCQVNDAVYFGHTSPFNSIQVVCSTAGAGAQTWVWEYYNGSGWSTLTTLNNGLVIAMTVGIHNLNFNPPANWVSTDPGNGVSAYYVRRRISVYTSLTTRGIYSQGWLGKWNQLFEAENGASAAHGVLYKIASASEPVEYAVNDERATNDTKNVFLCSVRDVDTALPFAHETVAGMSNSTTNQDASLALYSGNFIGAAQSFTSPAAKYRLASVKFYLKKVGSPTGNITAKLYTSAAGIIPTTPVLALSNTKNIATDITTDYQLIEFTFPWYQQYWMAASTPYVVGLEYGDGDLSNYLHVGYDTDGAGHTGNGSDLTGAVWTARSYDLIFYAYYFAWSSTTSSSGRFALPTMTTVRDNSLVLASVATAGTSSTPCIIEGPVSYLVGKDGASHSDGISWAFQSSSGTTPSNIYCSVLGTSWTCVGAVCAINPPSSGATVVPTYCVSDSSVYVCPSTGAAYLTDAATVTTVTDYFGSTLNGKTLVASGTTITYADTGINSYHAMRNVNGSTTAGRWAGNVTVVASRNLSNKNILFHIQPYLPVDIQTTDSVSLVGNCGVAIGFGSLANTNYKVWHVGGANTSWGASRHQPAVIHSSYEGAGLIQNSGTLDPSAVVNIGCFVSGRVVAPDWLFSSIWALDTTIIAGGNAAEPINIAGIVTASSEGHERRSVLRQGSSQFMIFQPLQIGDGGTNPTYLELDGTALEFPKQYDKDAKSVNYCSIDNVCGLKYYAGSGDTIIHKNSVISSESRYFWGLHDSSTNAQVYDFSGLSVIGAGIISLAATTIIDELTINDFSTIDAYGLTLTNSSILNPPAISDSISLDLETTFNNCSIDITGVGAGNWLCSVENPEIFQNCVFTGSGSSGHAMRIISADGYDITGNTFISFGENETAYSAIYNDSGGEVILTVGSGTGIPTIKNGIGATTTLIIDPVTTEITVVDIETSEPIVGARILMLAYSGGNLPYNEAVTISRSSSTATVSHNGHGLITGNKVQILGADQYEYNGIFTITYIDTNSYSYSVDGIPDTPATGSIKATAVIIDAASDENGVASDSRSFSIEQPIYGRVRKSTGTFYKTAPISGTISEISGLTLTTQLIPDE